MDEALDMVVWLLREPLHKPYVTGPSGRPVRAGGVRGAVPFVEVQIAHFGRHGDGAGDMPGRTDFEVNP